MGRQGERRGAPDRAVAARNCCSSPHEMSNVTTATAHVHGLSADRRHCTAHYLRFPRYWCDFHARRAVVAPQPPKEWHGRFALRAQPLPLRREPRSGVAGKRWMWEKCHFPQLLKGQRVCGWGGSAAKGMEDSRAAAPAVDAGTATGTHARLAAAGLHTARKFCVSFRFLRVAGLQHCAPRLQEAALVGRVHLAVSVGAMPRHRRHRACVARAQACVKGRATPEGRACCAAAPRTCAPAGEVPRARQQPDDPAQPRVAQRRRHAPRALRCRLRCWCIHSRCALWCCARCCGCVRRQWARRRLHRAAQHEEQVPQRRAEHQRT